MAAQILSGLTLESEDDGRLAGDVLAGVATKQQHSAKVWRDILSVIGKVLQPLPLVLIQGRLAIGRTSVRHILAME